MNIQEATKIAMENGKSIHRKSEFDVLRKPGDNLELFTYKQLWIHCCKTKKESLLSNVATNGRRLNSRRLGNYRVRKIIAFLTHLLFIN